MAGRQQRGAAGLCYAKTGERPGKSTRAIENQLRSARAFLQACNRAELVSKGKV